MADLSNLIYTVALSSPQQSGAAEPPAQRPRLPRQAGSARRLAPLLAILAVSLLLLSMSAFAGHVPATHEPNLNLVYRDARHVVLPAGQTELARQCHRLASMRGALSRAGAPPISCRHHTPA